jgi:hypothetical protein
MPRVLSIAFIAFLSLFALDVFSEGYGFLETIAALFMHLIPSFVLIGVLALAWRWEFIGAALFGAAGTFYLVSVVGESLPAAAKLSRSLIIAGPAFLIAILFLANWLKRAELRAGR